jgi:hypothetical protein
LAQNLANSRNVLAAQNLGLGVNFDTTDTAAVLKAVCGLQLKAARVDLGRCALLVQELCGQTKISQFSEAPTAIAQFTAHLQKQVGAHK